MASSNRSYPLSGLFAALQVGSMGTSSKWWLKPIYWIICTLVIFNAAIGGNASLSERSSSIKVQPCLVRNMLNTDHQSFGSEGVLKVSEASLEVFTNDLESILPNFGDSSGGSTNSINILELNKVGILPRTPVFKTWAWAWTLDKN